MSDTQPTDPARQKWLIDTLYALRGHFREKTPADPDNLRTVEDVSEGLIVRCMDRYLNEKHDLKTPKGALFEAVPPGAAVAPPELNLNSTLRAQLAVVYGTAGRNSSKKPKPLIIIGHEECGANRKLHDALLADHTQDHDDTLRLMLPMAPDEMQAALKDAKARGVDDAQMRRLVEQVTVLESMRNLYKESFRCDGQAVRVSDLVKKGEFQIIGALRSYDKERSLKVYDPEQHKFRLIEDIYREAFPFSEQAIIDRKEALQPPPVITDTDNHSVIVPQGATTETVAKFNLSDIKAGIAALLDKMRATGVTKS